MRKPAGRMAAAALVALSATAAVAHEVSGEGAADDAPMHHAAAAGARTGRTVANYMVPDVQMVREDGKTVRFREELQGDRSVVLSFIYTECTTICPVTSATLAQLQRRLGSLASKVQLVSISIDSDEDTPAELAAYAKKFRAGPGWRFYTGTAETSIEVQRAFDAYAGDKMRHAPDTYVRRAGHPSWVRLRGFATADELLAECGLAAAAK